MNGGPEPVYVSAEQIENTEKLKTAPFLNIFIPFLCIKLNNELYQILTNYSVFSVAVSINQQRTENDDLNLHIMAKPISCTGTDQFESCYVWLI